jgi:large subunit ribosomal protein L16
MLLFPSPEKTKYKKMHKGGEKRQGSFSKIEYGYFIPKKGFYGLKAVEGGKIKSNQLEAARKMIRKKVKRKIKNSLYINVFPQLSRTKKSSGVRMGKGKGNLDYWYVPVKKGQIIFEIKRRIPRGQAHTALKKAMLKFPMKCRVIDKFSEVF